MAALVARQTRQGEARRRASVDSDWRINREQASPADITGYFYTRYRLSSFDTISCTISMSISSNIIKKILNLRYIISINMLILTIYPVFPNLVIIVSKNQV